MRSVKAFAMNDSVLYCFVIVNVGIERGDFNASVIALRVEMEWFFNAS